MRKNQESSKIEGKSQIKGGSISEPYLLQPKIFNVLLIFTTIGFLVLYYLGILMIEVFQISLVVTILNITFDLMKEKGE